MALPQRYIEKDFYTEDEYLRWEEDAPYKSEYVRGDIRAMSGGTDDHGTIGMSVGSALVVALRGRGCRVMSSDVKVRTTDGVFRYPDVSVVCGPRQYHGRGRRVITNPLLVVEVLSDSTAATDRGEKFHEYQSLSSLTDYQAVRWPGRRACRAVPVHHAGACRAFMTRSSSGKRVLIDHNARGKFLSDATVSVKAPGNVSVLLLSAFVLMVIVEPALP